MTTFHQNHQKTALQAKFDLTTIFTYDLLKRKMKQETFTILSRVYDQLQEIAAQLYTAAEVALQNNDFDDASLLQSRADKIYEEAENIDTLIIELEDR
ncbi:hypothetical protein [Nostoc flagelliforme]|nr:hypothetical protein [Nostoc flagelliforme]